VLELPDATQGKWLTTIVTAQSLVDVVVIHVILHDIAEQARPCRLGSGEMRVDPPTSLPIGHNLKPQRPECLERRQLHLHPSHVAV
jgi:hypothetical protein